MPVRWLGVLLGKLVIITFPDALNKDCVTTQQFCVQTEEAAALSGHAGPPRSGIYKLNICGLGYEKSIGTLQ